MTRRLAAALVFFGLPALLWVRGSSVPAQAAAKEPEDPVRREVEREVLQALRERLEAASRNDTVAWARYVADDMLAPLEGELPSKQSWIRQHDSWPREVKYFYGPLEDVKVRVHGETAVVSFRSAQFTEFGGQTTHQNRWQIETWMRKAGRWQLVAIADGIIPLEPMAIRVDPALYEAYVGRYEWAPGLHSTLTREGDTLVEQFTGQGRSELLPETETSFFVKGEATTGSSSRFIFVKDTSGRVTHFIHRELGGTDRIVKRVP